MIQLQFRIWTTKKSLVVETDLLEREDANNFEKELVKILEDANKEMLKEMFKNAGWKVRMKHSKSYAKNRKAEKT